MHAMFAFLGVIFWRQSANQLGLCVFHFNHIGIDGYADAAFGYRVQNRQ